MKRLWLIPAALSLCTPLMVGTASAQGPLVALSADCSGSTESVTVLNNSDDPIAVYSVGSLHPTTDEEPFFRNDIVLPNSMLTYSFGGSNGGIKLTQSSILDESVEGEGAWVETSAGSIEALCSAPLSVQPLDGSGPAVTPRLDPTPASDEVDPSTVDIEGADVIMGPGAAAIPVPRDLGQTGPVVLSEQVTRPQATTSASPATRQLAGTVTSDPAKTDPDAAAVLSEQVTRPTGVTLAGSVTTDPAKMDPTDTATAAAVAPTTIRLVGSVETAPTKTETGSPAIAGSGPAASETGPGATAGMTPTSLPRTGGAPIGLLALAAGALMGAGALLRRSR